MQRENRVVAPLPRKQRRHRRRQPLDVLEECGQPSLWLAQLEAAASLRARRAVAPVRQQHPTARRQSRAVRCRRRDRCLVEAARESTQGRRACARSEGWRRKTGDEAVA
eukprot:6184045-Pleurochrysis_carterae.AAC.1